MPELPEVETTKRGISPHVCQQSVTHVIVRNHQLRWPIPYDLSDKLTGEIIQAVARRGKYLLLESLKGTVIIHLGMSGSLSIVEASVLPIKHDHVDIVFANKKILRLNDPRRFGCVLWSEIPVDEHPLLAELGPEPLSANFSGDYLYQRSRTRKINIKAFIMNSKIVVGVGNIYASESLYLAGIHPLRAANRISLVRYHELAKQIKLVLRRAIKQGGTTLQDFTRPDGKPGYFKQRLRVYGKADDLCSTCKAPIKMVVIAKRSTFYCAHCQS